jgi:hypothetical protein
MSIRVTNHSNFRTSDRNLASPKQGDEDPYRSKVSKVMPILNYVTEHYSMKECEGVEVYLHHS